MAIVAREVFVAWKNRKKIGADKAEKLEQNAFVTTVLSSAALYILVFSPMIVTSMVVYV